MSVEPYDPENPPAFPVMVKTPNGRLAGGGDGAKGLVCGEVDHERMPAGVSRDGLHGPGEDSGLGVCAGGRDDVGEEEEA